MNSRSPATAVAAALAATALCAAPASAANLPIVAGGAFVRTIPFIDGYIYEWECHAVAAGAVSVTISSCVLAARDTIGAPPVTSQGPVAATDLGASEDTANGRLCWTASARYSDGTTQSTSGCSLVANSLAGLG